MRWWSIRSPEEVCQQISACAAAMGVSDDMLTVLQALARGDRGLALADFERSGYTAGWTSSATAVLQAAAEIEGLWGAVSDDPASAARWEALAHSPEGSLGLQVWRFYKSRGLGFPGSPGSAPPYLAQRPDRSAAAHSRLVINGCSTRTGSRRRTDPSRRFAPTSAWLKSPIERDAGSRGPFELGSLSPFQHDAGVVLAAEERRNYEAWTT